MHHHWASGSTWIHEEPNTLHCIIQYMTVRDLTSVVVTDRDLTGMVVADRDLGVQITSTDKAKSDF